MICCYYLGEVREVTFQNGTEITKYKIPFPNIIITSKLAKTNQKWGNGSIRFYCTNKSIGQLPLTPIEGVDRNNGIWALAFPNMYNDGRMCYGQNSMPGGFIENNFRGLDWYFKVLYTAPFNSDLHVPEINEAPRNWIMSLSKLSKFPYEKLSGYKQEAGSTVNLRTQVAPDTVNQTVIAAANI